jgi:signal transduction histidine kinase
MKLKLFFLLIIGYVISAFGWLTYSLVNFSNNEYKLQSQVLKAGRQACILRLIEKGKDGNFQNDQATSLFLQQIELTADTQSIHNYLKKYNYASYVAEFNQIGEKLLLNIAISPSKKEELKVALNNKIRTFLFQSILLTLLVGAGVYGVYYSVNAIYMLNKQQNNFLLSVTHEFKTPIAAMKLMLQTIEQRELPRDTQKDLLRKAVMNADRLDELTENMLTAMQIENDRYQYVNETFNLSEMMHRLVDHYSVRNEVHASIEEDVHIKGDVFVLRISVNNLVENALKYSFDQPISVGLFQAAKHVVIEISDLGIGIPKNERKKIFKKFYRVQDEETRDTKGTGLGLYIVQQTIRKHGGSISIENNEPKGTKFIIKLPKV